jgi:ATP-dependent RNA helicase RhlE
MSFTNFNLCQPILKALSEHDYLVPTPIQQQAIPKVLEGRDLMACAQTGTGKTAAFSLPILHLLSTKISRSGIKVLVLAPTRELATQIADNITKYGKHLRLKHAVIFGGVNQHSQVEKVRRGVDILVATPGRLLDLMDQGHIRLNQLEILVLDEADRMLDMGFIHDIKRIIKTLPVQRQTLFFSATMPAEIRDLAFSILKNPAEVTVAPVSSTAALIDQSVYFVDKSNKRALLEHIIREKEMRNVLVFTKTKHGADKVAVALNKSGIVSEAIHGNKSQNARQRALDNFKRKTTQVLVATDIAARGIDVNDLQFVINYELPNVPETYVHRIGRTGRAGASGQAISFCDSEEKTFLLDIHKVIRKNIAVNDQHPFHQITSSAVLSPVKKSSAEKNRRPSRGGNWSGRRRNFR